MSSRRNCLALTLLITFAGLFSSLSLCAQPQLRSTYPVQVMASLFPPYSLYLADYANPSRERIALILLNRDLMQNDPEGAHH